MIAGSNVRGWFEPVSESSKWLKEIRTTVYSSHEANIKCFFVAGYVSFQIYKLKFIETEANNHFFFFWINLQIWYEVLRDILPDGELVAAPKTPLQLGDILNNGSQEHFSDRDTGESQFIRIQTENYAAARMPNAKWLPTRNCDETTRENCEQKRISCRS